MPDTTSPAKVQDGLLDRAAAALEDAHQDNPNNCRIALIAALKVLREPSEAMQEAGWAILDAAYNYDNWRALDPKGLWQAMLDALIGEDAA